MQLSKKDIAKLQLKIKDTNSSIFEYDFQNENDIYIKALISQNAAKSLVNNGDLPETDLLVQVKVPLEHLLNGSNAGLHGDTHFPKCFFPLHDGNFVTGIEKELTQHKPHKSSNYNQFADELFSQIKNYFVNNPKSDLNCSIGFDDLSSNGTVINFSTANGGFGFYLNHPPMPEKELEKELSSFSILNKDKEFIKQIHSQLAAYSKDETALIGSIIRMNSEVHKNPDFYCVHKHKSKIKYISNVGYSEILYQLFPKDIFERVAAPFDEKEQYFIMSDSEYYLSSNAPKLQGSCIFESLEDALAKMNDDTIVIEMYKTDEYKYKPVKTGKQKSAFSPMYFYKEGETVQMLSANAQVKDTYKDYTSFIQFKGKLDCLIFGLSRLHCPYGVNEPEKKYWVDGFESGLVIKAQKNHKKKI